MKVNIVENVKFKIVKIVHIHNLNLFAINVIMVIFCSRISVLMSQRVKTEQSFMAIIVSNVLQAVLVVLLSIILFIVNHARKGMVLTLELDNVTNVKIHAKTV